jgi:MoxR-like ATPase
VTPWEAVDSIPFAKLREEVEDIRSRINSLRREISRYFVEKDELIDLMAICLVAQEPLLFVGPPGTAKSALVTKFCEALGLDGDDYFEYMLTQFTEPSELLGPIDIGALKEGRYLRKTGGKLPVARIAFLDEIFKSNSAILNTLLTIINERKFYQDGRPEKVNLVMLFAATNQVPEFTELGALRDRFVLKALSTSVRESHFDELLIRGVQNDLDESLNRKPWQGIADLTDFLKLKRYLDCMMAGIGVDDGGGDGGAVRRDRKQFFPDPVFDLFKRVLRTLVKEDGLFISDRKVVKLYKLFRTRALLFHGGEVRKEDLVLLRYVGDRTEDLLPLREKVDLLLRVS